MEEWKDILGYEGIYQISSHGNVRSKTCILKKRIQNSGYQIVDLKDMGIRETKTIHRLVALAFIHNPDDKSDVDHINGDKLDNHVINLRWTTHSENKLNPNTQRPVGKSGHRNICQHIRSGLYNVFIKRNSVIVYQKSFKNLPDAINARDDFFRLKKIINL